MPVLGNSGEAVRRRPRRKLGNPSSRCWATLCGPRDTEKQCNDDHTGEELITIESATRFRAMVARCNFGVDIAQSALRGKGYVAVLAAPCGAGDMDNVVRDAKYPKGGHRWIVLCFPVGKNDRATPYIFRLGLGRV